MNTPTHVILAIAVLGKKDAPQHTPWIFWGALLPDMSMYVLLVYELLIGTPMGQIWDEKYFSPLWQNSIDVFNSIPIFLGILVIAWFRKWIAVQLLSLAALLHVVTDLLLHNDDAHRHFIPFSEWRFMSPVSYWDPAHYGAVWSVFEMGLLMVAGFIVYRMLQSSYARAALLGSVVLMVGLQLWFLVWW